jgi:hypothetical protein
VSVTPSQDPRSAASAYEALPGPSGCAVPSPYGHLGPAPLAPATYASWGARVGSASSTV